MESGPALEAAGQGGQRLAVSGSSCQPGQTPKGALEPAGGPRSPPFHPSGALSNPVKSPWPPCPSPLRSHSPCQLSVCVCVCACMCVREFYHFSELTFCHNPSQMPRSPLANGWWAAYLYSHFTSISGWLSKNRDKAVQSLVYLSLGTV